MKCFNCSIQKFEQQEQQEQKQELLQEPNILFFADQLFYMLPKHVHSGNSLLRILLFPRNL